MQKIGIVAGAGGLPVLVAKIAAAKGVIPVIVCLDDPKIDEEVGDFSPFAPTCFGLTQIESIIAHFHANQISDIVMVGKVERPVITPQTPIDATSAKLLQETLPHGDDAALRAILAVVQQSGLRVLPLQALVPEQKLGFDYDNGHGPAVRADGQIANSLTLGIKAHKRLSALDVGQAAIIEDNRIIAIEAAEGTDAMIKRAQPLLSTGHDALFFKASKTSQNKRLDPPVIGLQTIENCIKAGIRIIAIEAEHCLLAAPLPAIEALCAEHDIRLISVTLHEAPE